MSEEIENKETFTEEEQNTEEKTEDKENESSSEEKDSVEYWRKRAEKAEKAIEKNKKKSKSEKKSTNKDFELTPKDTFALIKANVNEEDIDDVVEYAKFKNISISEALKSSVVKSLLKEKEEKRKSAEASFSGKSRKVGTEVPIDVLKSNVSQGKFPENQKDIERLVKADLGIS